MKLSDIPKPSLSRQDSAEVRQLKADAPKHLRSLIERSIIFLDHNWDDFKSGDFELLSGGLNAVAYLVRKGTEYVVVKFDVSTMKAEAEALAVWWEAGAKVAAVRSSGTSPLSKLPDARQKVKYIILEGVTGAGNRPAELAMTYVQNHLDQAEAVGRYMGRQLALMHRPTTKRSFGEFSDMTGENKKSYRSWNAYLLTHVKSKQEMLIQSGFSEQQIRKLRRCVSQLFFPKTGRYLHGDFSLRNALIESRDPLKVRIIDPNPLIGNIHWDLAIPANNAAIAQKRAFLLPANTEAQNEAKLRVDFCKGVFAGYRVGTKRKIDDDKLLLMQLVQMLALYDIERDRILRNGLTFESDAEGMIRRNLLSEYMQRVLNL